MSMVICDVCEKIFDSDMDPDCWCGPNSDLAVCEACREEDASYENQAQPVNPWRPVSELPHGLTGKKVGQ